MRNISADILIIGAGPAGLTAGLYASRAGKKTVVLEGRSASRLSLGYEIENYPGFRSIDSRELIERFREHASQFGAEFVRGEVIGLSLGTSPKYVSTSEAFFEAKAVILATGRPMPKEKMLPGEERLVGFGVSYCATCDGPLYRGLDVAAYGHSEEAADEVLLLQQMGCKVHWVTGKAEETGPLSEKIKRAQQAGISTFLNSSIKEIVGADRVEGVILRTDGEERSLKVAGLFILREIPSGPLFEKAGLKTDHKQCLAVDRFQRTNLEGVFAAGDVTCGSLQIVSAAGEGCVAALQALSYLRRSG